MMNKACPVLLRNGEKGVEILAFCHPVAGNQLVKGGIEDGEKPEVACVRELFEEAGVQATAEEFLGEWVAPYDGITWFFYLMKSREPLLDRWEYFALDDGGHNFQFFWQPLAEILDDEWHQLFRRAIDFICAAVIYGRSISGN